MKVLTAKQIREADAFTIKNEPIPSIDLMERAATICFNEIIKRHSVAGSFHVFCGTGNNGGDGLVIARLLKLSGKEVHVYIIRYSSTTTKDFDINSNRLVETGLLPHSVTHSKHLPELKEGIIIDALLGTGLNRPLEGILANTSMHLNQSGLPIISIDLPSGIFDSNNAAENLQTVVRARYTLTFQVPKLCLFDPQAADFIGEWQLIDIGLNEQFIQSCRTDFETFGMTEAAQILKKRDNHSHKGSFGHAGLAVGSKGKMGAAILCAESCLRAGCGLLTCMIPACGYEIMQQGLPEAMVLTSQIEESLDDSFSTAGYQVIGCGPGIGVSPGSVAFIRKLVSSVLPQVLDADALNILAIHPELKERIPKQAVLTPHPKEFERLFGQTNSFDERIRLLQKEAQERNVVILLKGHYSAVASPDGLVTFNLSGNPGMATAGSGDVLTGIITALLAQGYSAASATRLGSYIHGLAGDIAAENSGQEAMIASDITHNLGEAFKRIHSLQE